ncbi:MAG TPA: hypothetical protein VLL52_14320, partial [Anaerolineae bacterium]|nr:hypothetical protein [Anaerolineae bacterium]
MSEDTTKSPPPPSPSTGHGFTWQQYLQATSPPIPVPVDQANLIPLNKWLHNPHSPRHLTLYAPPGNGQSTLLAHWCTQFSPDQPWRPIFITVSPHLATTRASGFWSLAATQLAALHNAPLPAGWHTNAKTWQELFERLLPKPLPKAKALIIVDGLEEAHDQIAQASSWHIPLPDTTRLVLSHNQPKPAWLPTTIPTATIQLPSTTPAPLWLQLQKRLPNQTPLDQWATTWDPATQQLAALFVTAHGPLTTSNLANAFTHWGYDDDLLTNAIDTLSPLLNLTPRETYTWFHPHLQQWTQQQLPSAPLSQAHTYLTQRTQQILDEAQQPDAPIPSKYWLNFTSSHLLTQQAPPEQWLKLLNGRWAQATKTHHTHYGPFLDDVDRIWDTLQQADNDAPPQRPWPWRSAQAACGLYYSSIRSLTGTIPPKLLAMLVHINFWSPAQVWTYLERMDESQKSEALTELIPYLPNHLRHETLYLLPTITYEGYQAQVLRVLLPFLGQEDLELVLELLPTMQHNWYRASLLGRLAYRFPEPDRRALLVEALILARQVPYEGDRARILNIMAPYLPADLQNETLNFIREFRDEWSKASALSHLIPYLTPNLQAAVTNEAFIAAQRIPHDGARVRALSEVVPLL